MSGVIDPRGISRDPDKGHGCQDVSSVNIDDEDLVVMTTVIATTDYTPPTAKAQQEYQLTFEEGDRIHILEKSNDVWWWAELEGTVGYIPASYVMDINDVRTKQNEEEEDKYQSEEYFGGYSALKLHHEMLSDKARTTAYWQAIKTNQNYLRGKVILDVGCGSGILSLFCVRDGGAERVYAVEASDIADQAEAVINHNGFSSKIEVIKEKLEEVDLPEKVDVIISEWMGTMLLFELMVESVLVARDRWLSPGGVMWPSISHLYLVPCSLRQLYNEKVTFWEDVYGFDFSLVKPEAVDEFFGKPIHNFLVDNGSCLSRPCCILRLDMKTLKVEQLEKVKCVFDTEIERSGVMHGFASWFSVDFCSLGSDGKNVTLDTAPTEDATHWKQDLFMMDKPLKVVRGDRLHGTLTMVRNLKWRRHLKVKLSYTLETTCGQTQKFSKSFALWR